jgi:rod shape-determining protein MreC
LIGSIEDLWTGYVGLIDTEEENTGLRYEVHKLEEGVAESRALRQENGLLRSELSFKRKRRDLKLAAAHVIAKDVSAFARVVRAHIDTGRFDGIRQGMPVLTSHGLVGRVQQVSGRYAEVMLTVDTRSEVAVRVVGKSVTGIVRGKGDRREYLAQFLYLPGREQLDIGDRVVTSGHDQIFPPNLEVGTIRSLAERQDGVYQRLEVTPSVSFSVLDVVQIVLGTVDENADEATAVRGGP